MLHRRRCMSASRRVHPMFSDVSRRPSWMGVRKWLTDPETDARIKPEALSGKVTLRAVDLAELRVEIVEKRGFRGHFPNRALHKVAGLQQAAKAVDALAEPAACGLG